MSLFSGLSSRLRGTPNEPEAPKTTTPPSLRPSRSSQTSMPPKVPVLPTSPSLADSISMAATEDDGPNFHFPLPLPLPLWLSPIYAKHIVKGNFMTLSARPKVVEEAEWIAHQVVEHYRLLWNFVRVVIEKEQDGNTICNPSTCPTMSAGKNHSYPWLNKRLEPTELPAHEYIALMQRWISGKIDNVTIFPTDPSTVSYAPNSALVQDTLIKVTGADGWIGKRSGFPEDFSSTCRTIFLQMFRVYSHLYWSHFVEPFYHLNLEKQLNSCFSHFLMTATALDMLQPDHLEPMQCLIDLWAANGTFPPQSKAYSYANLKRGTYLMRLGGGR
uniref:Mob1/phocein family protein n=1 Tax=Photinus pyralis TaxID=7054 RepID=A0A1Y1K805_PHOPY